MTPKNEAQQPLLTLDPVREALVSDRLKANNQIHAFLLEFGIGLPIRPAALRRLSTILAEQALLPRLVQVLERLQANFKYLNEQITEVEK